MTTLRFITYLAPGLPVELFQDVVDAIGSELGCPVELAVESLRSGPIAGDDPLADGTADFAWMCTPAYLNAPLGGSTDSHATARELVPAAFVFDDPRNGGRPGYHSDVIVRHDNLAQSFESLRGSRFTYNDPCSQSGYHNLLATLAAAGEGANFFAEWQTSGSHLHSIEAVARGTSDAAAIDSNVLMTALRRNPDLARSIRILTSWGPHAMQPLVAGSHVDSAVVDEVAAALLELPRRSDLLAPFGISTIAPISASDYDCERRSLKWCAKFLRNSCEKRSTARKPAALL